MSTLLRNNTTSGGNESSFFNSGGNTTNTQSVNEPRWFQNSKKRTITNHLVPKRKSGFHLTSESSVSASNKKESQSSRNLLELDSSVNNEYNLLSFGSNQRKALTASGSKLDIYDTSSGDLTKLHDSNNDTIDDDFPLYDKNDDLPPSRSIYDLNDEVLISLNRPTNQNTDSFINKDPKSYNNVFTKFNDQNDLKNNNHSTNTNNNINANNNANNNHNNNNSNINNASKIDHLISSNNPLNHSESAVLVFGYPETMANQVIAHFQEIGTILEDFEVNKHVKNYNNKFLQDNNNESRLKIPIFSGKSWVKITFDNPTSAIDSLQENGSVFNGVIIGVVPYTKQSIEKLQKRKLTDNEDIGGGIKLHNSIESNSIKIDNGIDISDNQQNSSSSHVKRLDIKDGSELFLKSNNNDPTKSETDKKNDENLGLLGKICKFFFGFNEL